MSRSRFAALLAASSLGLMPGCMSLSDHPMFSWLHRPATTEGCCEAGACSDGPMLGDCGGGGSPMMAAPGMAAPVTTVPPMSSCGTPMLSPAPRLTPQPAPMSPTMPSVPPQ